VDDHVACCTKAGSDNSGTTSDSIQGMPSSYLLPPTLMTHGWGVGGSVVAYDKDD